MLPILATGFSDVRLLHVLRKWPALDQVPVIIVYAPVSSLKKNVGIFFPPQTPKNSDTGKMVILFSTRKAIIYPLSYTCG